MYFFRMAKRVALEMKIMMMMKKKMNAQVPPYVADISIISAACISIELLSVMLFSV